MKYKFFNKTGFLVIIIFITVITAAFVVDLVFFWDLGPVVIVALCFAWVLCLAVLLRAFLLFQTILIDADGIHLYVGKREKRVIKWEELVEIKSYYNKKQKKLYDLC